MQASGKPHKLHRQASVPQGEYCYLQSPLMTFMADDIDLEQPPFTMLIGKRPGMSLAHPSLTHCPQKRACLAGCRSEDTGKRWLTPVQARCFCSWLATCPEGCTALHLWPSTHLEW